MATISALRFVLAALLLLATSAFLRLLYILPLSSHLHQGSRKKHPQTKSHMLIVLGSGGHTAEMMSLLRNVDPKRYTRRTYIVSKGDELSGLKAQEIENGLQRKDGRVISKPTEAGETHSSTGMWDIKFVPRAREIHQPLSTAPISSYQCFMKCRQALGSISEDRYPDVIITNGPATAVMVILAAAWLKFFGLAPVWKMKIIYVESWARVKSLSLSGKILLHMGVCDEFLVQWESLANSTNGSWTSAFRQKVKWKGFLVE